MSLLVQCHSHHTQSDGNRVGLRSAFQRRGYGYLLTAPMIPACVWHHQLLVRTHHLTDSEAIFRSCAGLQLLCQQLLPFLVVICEPRNICNYSSCILSTFDQDLPALSPIKLTQRKAHRRRYFITISSCRQSVLRTGRLLFQGSKE